MHIYGYTVRLLWRGRIVWPSARAWKARNLKGFEGSNPSLSATFSRSIRVFASLRQMLGPVRQGAVNPARVGRQQR